MCATLFYFLILLLAGVNLIECIPFVIGEENAKSSISDLKDVPEMTQFRLPNTSVPISYKLQIMPDLSNFTFQGHVVIDVLVKERTKDIYLHSNGLSINFVQIFEGLRRLYPTPYLEPENQMLRLDAYVELEPNHIYNVEITFNGTLDNKMSGFYRSHYKVGNKIKWLATTQFEPTHARSAFPCYDEPTYRAQFEITIIRYQHQKAISNMPLLKTSRPDPMLNDRVYDKFQPTPAMPTYLVAFIISEFSVVSDASKTVSVYTPENLIEYATYSLSSAQKVLKQMENFTDIKYTLPKMDLVAIPDFHPGAMENWGLTTYKERYLIYHPKLSSINDKQQIIEVIAHEIAHQWFGNLVTPAWWDYLWLSEAFATYFEHHIVNEIEPTWKEDQVFVIETFQQVLFVDGIDDTLNNSIIKSVKSPLEIALSFDNIVYKKGASILRMLEHIISFPMFKKSLNLYLKKGNESGGSVHPNNLWDVIDVQINGNKNTLPQNTSSIQHVMNTWINYQGYPLIVVRRVVNGNHTNITISQETYKSPRATEMLYDQEWIVPLSYTKQSSSNFMNTQPRLWSVSRSNITLMDEVTSNEWILFNIQQTGYFRVNYDEENWKLLAEQLNKKFDVIHLLNRAQLIDDTFSLAIDQKLTFNVTFQILSYLHREVDAIPLFAAFKKMKLIYNRYHPFFVNSELKNYMIEKIRPHFQRIGFCSKPDDDHLTKNLRMSVVEFACDLGMADCVNSAMSEYMKNKKNLKNLDPDTKKTLFCTLMKSNLKEEIWDRIWNLYRESIIVHERDMLLVSAGCGNNRTFLKRNINKLSNAMDKSSTSDVLKSLFSTNDGISAGLEFIDDLSPGFSNFKLSNWTMVSSLLSSLKSNLLTDKLNLLTDEQKRQVDNLINKLENFTSEETVNISIRQLTSIRDENAKISSYNKAIVEDLSNALKNWPVTTEKYPTTTPTVSHKSSTANKLTYSIFTTVYVTICSLLLLK